MLVFIDTEFTGFEENADLISIGMVTDTPIEQTFYEEISDLDMTKCSDFVLKHVLPLRGAADQRKTLMQTAFLCWDWLDKLGQHGRYQIAADFHGDVHFLNMLLHLAATSGARSGHPRGLEPNWLNIFPAIQSDAIMSAMEQHCHQQKLRIHHALDDAKRNKFGWLLAQSVAAQKAAKA